MASSFALTDDGYVLLHGSAEIAVPSPLPFWKTRTVVRRLVAGERVDASLGHAFVATVVIDGDTKREELAPIVPSRFLGFAHTASRFATVGGGAVVAMACLVWIALGYAGTYYGGSTLLRLDPTRLSDVVMKRASDEKPGFAQRTSKDTESAIIRGLLGVSRSQGVN